MLRLTPINPVTVSYVLGATRATFSTYLVACLGLIPSVAVEVYFGYGQSISRGYRERVASIRSCTSALTIVGLLLCVAMLLYIIRLAHRAMAGIRELCRRTPANLAATYAADSGRLRHLSCQYLSATPMSIIRPSRCHRAIANGASHVETRNQLIPRLTADQSPSLLGTAAIAGRNLRRLRCCGAGI